MNDLGETPTCSSTPAAIAGDAVAMAEETSVSTVIREAIQDRIEKRRGDKEFQARLQAAVERNKEALDLLAK